MTRVFGGSRAGVIAAGWGERLRGTAETPKPLVPVGGTTLIARVLTSIAETSPREVVVIVNEASAVVRDRVSAGRWPFALRWIVESTPSSMHSFLRVVEGLAEGGNEGPFLISTVDTIAAPGAFAAFASACRAASVVEADVALAVTSNLDDEKPLLVSVAGDSPRVTAIGDRAAGSALATAGCYSVRATVLREAAAARADGLQSLRAFLARLLDRGYGLAAVPLGDSIDVDRPGDVAAAERFLGQVHP